MPTPRRRYFFVSDEILREPWPRDAKLTMVLLLAALNMRRARDGKGAREACTAIFSRAALAELTGRAQLVHSRRALRALQQFTSISIEELGEFTRITWPKVAEFQQWHAAGRPGEGRERAERHPPPYPYSDSVHRSSDTKGCERGSDSEQVDLRPLLDAACDEIGNHGPVPDRLSEADRERFSSWLLQHLPEMWAEREQLERDCLVHYRQHPDRARRRRSWLATVEAWAKVAARRREEGATP